MTIEHIADRIAEARGSGRPIAPIRDQRPVLGVGEAYAIQALNTARRRARGGRTVGRKIGLTSDAVRAQLGVSEPDSGWLWADCGYASGATIPFGTLIAPRVEAEIALVLARDIDADTLTIDQVAAAVSHAVAALEIVDSAIADWNIGLVDTVADNASGWGFVLGDPQASRTQRGFAGRAMALTRNGIVESRGVGSATMGDPLIALAWLARDAAARGVPLRAGEVILTGALGPVLPASPDDWFEARIDGFAPVTVHFADRDRKDRICAD